MGNPIPQERRISVGRRDRMLCARCSMKGTEWHHRRKRNVYDDHQHCNCVGVMLCQTCHRWAHANPTTAQLQGLIVSQFEAAPYLVPQRRRVGWWVTPCSGLLLPVRDDQMQFGGGAPPRLLVPVERLTARPARPRV